MALLKCVQAARTLLSDPAPNSRRAMARKIINALHEPDWRKAMLRTWYPQHPPNHPPPPTPLRLQANMVDLGYTDANGVFQEGRGSKEPPDPGYLRAFEKAREEMKVMRREISQLYMEAA